MCIQLLKKTDHSRNWINRLTWLATVNQTILAILHDWMQQAPNMAYEFSKIKLLFSWQCSKCFAVFCSCAITSPTLAKNLILMHDPTKFLHTKKVTPPRSVSNGVWISSATPLCRVAHHLQFWQKHQNGLLVPDDITAKFHCVYSSRPTAIASETTRKGQRQTGFRPTPWTRSGGEWPRRCQDVCEAERDGERQQARREESTWGYWRKRHLRPRWIIHAASVHMRQPGNQRSNLVTIQFYGSPYCKYPFFKRSEYHCKTFAKHQSPPFSRP